MGNFKATLQLLGKGNITIQKHLLYAKINARYTRKTIHNDITLFYASKIREHLSKQNRENSLPYTIIADEVIEQL